jgi:hypothetical protein
MATSFLTNIFNKKRNKFAFYALIIAVYTGFFAVQLNFNFDVFTASVKEGVQFKKDYKNKNSKENTTVKESKSSSPHSNIRLNKRFQPTIIGTVFTVADPVIQYLFDTSISYYYDENLLSAVSLTYSLRGPPVLSSLLG